VHVDQQTADPGLELRRDPPLLLSEAPGGLVGRRHRVVGRGEGDLVEPAIAQRFAAVAGTVRRIVAARHEQGIEDRPAEQGECRRRDEDAPGQPTAPASASMKRSFSARVP